MKKTPFFIEDLKVEPPTNLLVKNGKQVKLEPKIMSLLCILAENAGEVISKEMLIEKNWKDVFVTEQVLKVAVSELRKSLDDDAKNPKFIKTIPKKGYQLIADVKPFEENRQQAEIIEKPGSRKFIWTFGILGLIVLGVLAWKFLSPNQTTVKTNSIAVLPLRDISENPAEEFFADGLTEAIITNLAKGNLKVISPRSVLAYKNSAKKPSEIAEELNVETLLEGTILRSGEKVRLNANLIDGKTEKLIWAETYEQNLSDVLELQAKLSTDISRQISLKLTPQTTKNTQVNPEAFDNYLKGRFFWNKRKPDTMQKSLAYFQKAIELEPDNALYHSGIADSYILLAFYSPNGSKELYEKAKAAASRALEIDPNLAEAHTSLGGVLHKYELDWQGAEREFQKAIELNPNYPTAHQWYAIFLMSKGEHEKALPEIKKSLELDPLSLIIRTDKGWLLYVAGRYDEAIEQLKAVNELDQTHGASYFLILAYCQKRMFDEAITEANRAIERIGRNADYVSLLGYAQALSGKKTEALKILEELKKMPSENVSMFQFALLYRALGDQEKAIDYLEKVIQNRSSWQPFLETEPSLENLKTHPRFQNLMKQINSSF